MAAASYSNANNVFRNLVLANHNLRLMQKKWFDLLQDEGVAMTAQEKPQYSGNPNKKKRECVRHGDHFFANIYCLLKVMVTPYWVKVSPGDDGVNDAAIPKIATSQGTFSTSAHIIGSFIAKIRRKVARGYINSINDNEFNTQTQCDEYKKKLFLFPLSSWTTMLGKQPLGVLTGGSNEVHSVRQTASHGNCVGDRGTKRLCRRLEKGNKGWEF